MCGIQLMIHQNNRAKVHCMIAGSSPVYTLQSAACTHHIHSTLQLSNNNNNNNNKLGFQLMMS